MHSHELDSADAGFWRTRILLAAVVFALLGNVYLVARCNQLEAVIAANSAAMKAQIRNLARATRDAESSKESPGVANEPLQTLPDSRPRFASAARLDPQR